MSSLSNLTSHIVSRTSTPQTSPIPGREAEMVPNSAGGFTFQLDDWGRLSRFLILGCEAGTYYSSEQKLTRENAAVVERLLKVDGPRVVREIVAMSDSGRAPKTGPILFAFAMCLKLGDDATKAEARAAFNKVVRIGTHLFDLATAVQAFGGWGRGTQRNFANWYLEQEPAKLALNLIKYQSRNGWSNRDVLRLAKPHGHEKGGVHDQLLHWATKGWPETGATPHPDAALRQVWAFERAKLPGASVKEVRALITDYNLPRECVPTEMLNDVSIWDALLDNGGKGMPITALIRNLGKMTSVGLISPLSAASQRVAEILTNADILKRGRVHPLALLVALKTYAQGHGEKGKLTWSADQKVVDALDTAFYASFGSITPMNKRVLLALDVSGSMHGGVIAGLPGITPAVATAAMAMVAAQTEPDHTFCAFSHNLVPVELSPKMRLDAVVAKLQKIPMGGTDCSLPMKHALSRKLNIDACFLYTDCETYGGSEHTVQSLDRYQKATGIQTRMAVVGFTATEFTIADPKRNDMLDFVGFDPAAPEVMSQFVLGKL